ncbi:hypothetical protein DPMN_103731 [Dreissena polymorpha]|uniref:Uncharacterized protein n=1 Tax=Dreissena polymorpha TaxID=45954 RepID=A0A9D4H910_DREPO|nr:hypothetical protein DPMN_103731 [Dreissena polymorpha]
MRTQRVVVCCGVLVPPPPPPPQWAVSEGRMTKPSWPNPGMPCSPHFHLVEAHLTSFLI